jgi:AGZA family xanthine/uracil permease-like MFS transporter
VPAFTVTYAVAIILSILAVTGAAFLLGVADPPEAVFSAPPSLAPTFLEFDLFAAVTWGFFSVVLSVLVLDFVDTLGTLYAVALQGGMLDENHELPDVRKPMLADALATTLAGVLGTTSAGAYLESATGIEAGGRTGLTAVTTALLFLLALFLSPLLTAAPACAYGPALIAVGLLMMRPMREMDMQDMSEAVPSFLIITLMSFTYDLGIGITAGFVFYPLLKLFTGRGREVSINLWALCLISAAFFVFYPQ